MSSKGLKRVEKKVLEGKGRVVERVLGLVDLKMIAW